MDVQAVEVKHRQVVEVDLRWTWWSLPLLRKRRRQRRDCSTRKGSTGHRGYGWAPVIIAAGATPGRRCHRILRAHLPHLTGRKLCWCAAPAPAARPAFIHGHRNPGVSSAPQAPPYACQTTFLPRVGHVGIAINLLRQLPQVLCMLASSYGAPLRRYIIVSFQPAQHGT